VTRSCVRVFAVDGYTLTTVDRELTDILSVGDTIVVNSRDMVVRSVIPAASGNVFDAIIYSTVPLDQLRRSEPVEADLDSG
jgi:hypothetical protein